jgi:uncharacterized membrane protein
METDRDGRNPVVVGAVVGAVAGAGYVYFTNPCPTAADYLQGALTGALIGSGVGDLAALGAGAFRAGLGRAIVPQIVKNRIAGNTFRDELAALLRQAGREVRTEVYKKTPFGGRYIDIEVRLNGKILGGIETKVGSSRYTNLQQLKDWWLKNIDGYIVNVARQP